MEGIYAPRLRHVKSLTRPEDSPIYPPSLVTSDQSTAKGSGRRLCGLDCVGNREAIVRVLAWELSHAC